MARPLRIDVSGGWYHVTCRGNERQPVFRDDRDRRRFLELLAEWTERFGLLVHAYVLMTNHYHLLVETPRANLSAAMQWLQVSYTMWFNRRHERAGHLFQGRFKAIVLDPETAAWEVSRYVHLNPVRVKALGLDKESRSARATDTTGAFEEGQVRQRLEALRKYAWSSCRAYVGSASSPDWLTRKRILRSAGGRSESDQMKAYREYVEQAIREGLPPSPWERLEAGIVLGGDHFVRRIRERLRGNPREQPQLRDLQARPKLEDVIAAVEGLKGRAWKEFRDEHGDWGRDLALYAARRYCGLTLRELAEAVGVDYGSVAVAVKRFGLRMDESKKLQGLLAKVKEKLSNV